MGDDENANTSNEHILNSRCELFYICIEVHNVHLKQMSHIYFACNHVGLPSMFILRVLYVYFTKVEVCT